MGDAEIIPLGTRGRPGRGTGRRRPSSAARDLAGSRSGESRAGPSAPGADAGPGVEENSSAPQRPTSPAASGEQESSPTTPGDQHPARTRDRTPAGAPGPSELLAALQQGARQVFGADWEHQLAGFLAALRRRLTGEYPIDEFGFDPELTDRLLAATMQPIAEKWFRIEVRGAENIPADGGALVVSNHSGTLPVDAMMTMAMVRQHTGRHLRALGADLVFRMPVLSGVARKGGATLACQEDAERLLRGGDLVGVWPEGFKGIGKPFSERYKLQRFGRGGFVSAAMRTGVPIVPLSVVGAEEIYPMVGNLPALARLLGLPYIPITPTFPLLGPLGLVPLPSKWLLEFGAPIRTDSYDEGSSEDPMLVFEVTDQVRETIQQTLYQLLAERPHPFG